MRSLKESMRWIGIRKVFSTSRTSIARGASWTRWALLLPAAATAISGEATD